MIRYIILYCSTCAVCIIMCYIVLFIDNIDSILQLFLIHFFDFLSWIIVIVGAIKCMPEKSYSNKRVWFYCAAMSGILAAIKSVVRLIEISGTEQLINLL